MILLVNPKQQTKYPQPPLGLLTLASVLEEARYPVQILDLNILTLSEIRDSDQIELIGVTSTTPAIKQAIWTIRVLRSRFPKIPIILGGPHPSLVPEIKSDPSITQIVRGEGEKALLDLLNPERQLPLVESEQLYTDLDTLPPMAFHLVDLSKYHLHPPHGRRKPNLPIITSRGCPFHCIFCSKGVFGSVYRTQSPDKTIEDLKYYISRFGVKEVTFYDDSKSGNVVF